ncbi:sugar fermentation stimulation protein [Clostridium thermobutyricum]|uniref:Sugar fermentation stimulation protein homolog n=1 Tax=Clostridium thermobutyricum TaxID=29372 RepID=N9WJP7_9CLOT|nr:DNA/RNA nuclease SfsA [Clostridium thermobutyricum]ENZ03110.1 sugar fermentation stimulation protein [Clostridium thermobutyricum]
MEYIKEITEAEFINRPNRFNALVKINGKEEIVHVPNTGRCKEILIPGTKILLRKEDNPTRKTKYDLICAYKGDKLINIDSQIPNKVVMEALINKKVGKLIEYNSILKEKTFGKSRFDFKLEKETGEEYYLEVKGVTLENNGYASFPDAPTDRGRKHLLELVKVKEEGKGAGVLFLIQMEGIKEFTSNDENDPAFGEALRYAKENGVDIFVYSCIVSEKEITLNKEVKLSI